jgi:hypothetical protein
VYVSAHTLHRGGLDGRGGVYLREYLSVALPFAETRAAKGVPPFDS